MLKRKKEKKKKKKKTKENIAYRALRNARLQLSNEPELPSRQTDTSCMHRTTHTYTQTHTHTHTCTHTNANTYSALFKAHTPTLRRIQHQLT